MERIIPPNLATITNLNTSDCSSISMKLRPINNNRMPVYLSGYKEEG